MLGELERDHRFVVADLEAGIGTTLRLERGAVDVALVVAEPTAKGIEVARRAADAATSRHARVVVIANKVHTDEDRERIAAALEGHELVVVPDDADVARADRFGAAPLDVAPETPAVRALVDLAERLAAPAAAG